MAVKKLRHHRHTPLQKNKTEILKSNNKEQQYTKVKVKDGKTLVIAQEIKFARLLANNDKKVRDKVLKNLKKWLTARSRSSFAFTEMDFMNLWKGLFYCMWMSDKMLIQEELAESLSKIVHCFNSKDIVVLYTTCALKTLAIEWFGIDRYRIDKFSMLVRRILRQTFIVCKDKLWDSEWVKEISQMFEKLFLYSKTDIGFNLHMTEIYMEELAKVSGGKLSDDTVSELIKPFAVYLMTTNDERQMKHIMRHIFRYLIFQSDIGLDYVEKFQAWRSAGFPCTHVDDMEKIEVSGIENNSENEDEQFSETEIRNTVDKSLDPRAGKVDVELPQIPVNPTKIIQLLTQYKLHSSSRTKSRRHLSRLLEEYKELSEGRMPLGIKKIRKPCWLKKDMDSMKAARRLIRFEKKIYSDNTNRKKKRTETLIKIDSNNTSLDNLRNGDMSVSNLDTNEKEIINAETESSDTVVLPKKNAQNTDSDIVPLKKRKKSDATYNKLSSKCKKIAEDRKMSETKDLRKKNKISKEIKLNSTTNKQAVNKNVERKTKKIITSGEWQVSDNENQRISHATLSERNVSPKEAVSKPAIMKKMSQKSVKHNYPMNKLVKKLRGQIDFNDSTAKKKVTIVLNRNTEQHTSEYIRQVRKSPAIPFDANKKPPAGVLKASPIPSPINPFYKKTLA